MSPPDPAAHARLLFDAPLERGHTAASMQAQLHRRIKSAILDGRLPPGCRMPGTRALAEQLAVSRNTVTAAYDHLAAEGYIEADRQGTRVAVLVAPKPPDAPHEPATPSVLARRVQEIAGAAPPALTTPPALLAPTPMPAKLPPGRSEATGVAPRAEASGVSAESAFAFRPGTPALSHFPLAAWRRALDRAIRAGGAAALAYGDPMGEAALRRAIAAHLAVTRGVRCTAAQIVVTDGAQAALDLCIGLLTNPGDTAWVEDPGYRGAKAAMRAGDLRVVPIRVDAQGLAASDDDWRSAPPRVVYTSPSHQYPTGAVMTAARRLALIDAARRHGAWVIEDDYDSEFRYASEPIGAMQGLMDDAPVLYVGSFSKTMFPSLRLGFVVLPQAIAERVPRVLGERLRGGSRHAQLAMAEFIDSGQTRRQRGRGQRGQKRVSDSGVDGEPAELQVSGPPALDERAGAGAVVARSGFTRALVEHGEFPPADPAGGQALQQGAALADGPGARLVTDRAGVGGDLLGVGQVGVPVDITGMVVLDQDLPLLAGQDPTAGPDLAVLTQAAFELRSSVDIGAGIGRVGQHVVHGVVGRLDPSDLSSMQIRRWGQRPLQALCAQPQPHRAGRSARSELLEHRSDDTPHRLVRMKQDLGGALTPDQPNRQSAA